MFCSVLKIPASGSHISFGAICGAGLAEKIMKIPVKIDCAFISKIAFVWCIKIPVSMFVAMFMFYEFKGIFTKYDGFGGTEEF